MAINQTQVNSYQEKLLEAMQLVSSQLISSIPYDKTVTCVIIDDTDSKKGKYIVSQDGNITFEAYSSDTGLKKDEVVYVTIPEGNYDNQKIIQGKKTNDNDKPFIFTTPFDTMLDLTDNLIIHTSIEQGNKRLIANNGYVTEIQNIDETNNKEVIKSLHYKSKELCHLTGLNHTGYTRLGLKADFMSWLPNVNKGSYGLKVTVMDNLNTTTTDDKTVTSVQQTKTMLLDVSDMYGNPYHFENYYSQEKVFPITELNTITDIIIEFYQIAGSFYDVEENILTLQDAEAVTSIEGQTTYETSFGDNLFVDNVEVCLGYDVSEIADEYIVPVINDSMTYSAYRESELNKKEIDLRWVHQFADGPKVVEPESDFGDGETQLKDCEIRWYRYRLGAAAADEYSGVYWTGLTVTKQQKASEEEEDKYLLSVWDGKTKQVNDTNPDGTPKLNEDGSEKMKDVPDYGETQALKNVIFSPDTSFQTEQIKAIIFLNGVAIRGPVITFRNEQSTTGSDVSDFLNALEIECVDGTSGNYLIYNEAGNILNTADSQLERKLSCNFAETGTVAKSNLLLDYEKGDAITWKIPIQNSMVSIQRCGKSNTDKYEVIQLTDETYTSNTYFTKEKNNEYKLAIGDFDSEKTYYIRNLITETIQLDKVWTQIEEYKGPTAAWEDFMEFVPVTNGEIVEYYGYQKLNYLKVTLDSTTYEKDKYYIQDIKTGGYQLSSFEEFQQDINYYERKKIYDSENKPVLYYRHSTASKGFETYYEPWNIYIDPSRNYLILQNERTLHYDRDTKITSILYPTYKVGAMYSMYNMNNIIACTIRKDRMIYTTEKEFTFGVSGTMGSDKSIVIDFVGGQTAIIPGSGEAYQLEVKMYDENNKPEDLSGVKIEWSWYTPGNGTLELDALRYAGSELNTDVNAKETWKRAVSGTGLSVIDLEFGATELSLTDTKQIFIAEVTVGEKEAALTTYFPIPLKKSEEYSHIDGATSVIYLSNGEPEYYKGDYKLYTTVDDTIGSPTVEVSNEDIVWEVISQEHREEGTQEEQEKSRRYTASIGTKTVDGKTVYTGLQPISVYTAGVKNYAVIAKTKIGNKVVWQQPILVIKNKYPSRVINKWDGKTLTMDKETGTILSTAIAAGRKDDANTFTGVMIGDWTATVSDNSLTEATGVFGFHEGEMSYALTDDGKFFIGKNGRGRINFDGNSGTIGDAIGNMKINLDNGQIDAKRLTLKAGNFSDEGEGVGQFIVLDTQSKEQLPEIDAVTPPSHGVYPFEIGRFFKADYTGQIYAKEGTIGAWCFSSTETTKEDKETNKKTSISAGSLYSNTFALDEEDYHMYQDPIILDPKLNTVTGGKFIASILEAKEGTIKLGGYLDVYPIPIDNTGINYSVKGAGRMGYMSPDMGSNYDKIPGIGLQAEYQETTEGPISMASVKATGKHVGMSYNTSYLYLSDTNGVMHFEDEIKDEEGTRKVENRIDFDLYGIKMTSSYGGRLIADADHLGYGFNDDYFAVYDGSVEIMSSGINGGDGKVNVGVIYGTEKEEGGKTNNLIVSGLLMKHYTPLTADLQKNSTIYINADVDEKENVSQIYLCKPTVIETRTETFPDNPYYWANNASINFNTNYGKFIMYNNVISSNNNEINFNSDCDIYLEGITKFYCTSSNGAFIGSMILDSQSITTENLAFNMKHSKEGDVTGIRMAREDSGEKDSSNQSIYYWRLFINDYYNNNHGKVELSARNGMVLYDNSGKPTSYLSKGKLQVYDYETEAAILSLNKSNMSVYIADEGSISLTADKAINLEAKQSINLTADTIITGDINNNPTEDFALQINRGGISVTNGNAFINGYVTANKGAEINYYNSNKSSTFVAFRVRDTYGDDGEEPGEIEFWQKATFNWSIIFEGQPTFNNEANFNALAKFTSGLTASGGTVNFSGATTQVGIRAQFA